MKKTTENHGILLHQNISMGNVLPFIGVYDVFSASIAAEYFDGIFISGFSFSASFYGLPDIGLISWSDIIAFTRRVRTILPHHHILVDIDDGYADTELACHVVSLLESAGASGVIMEDQTRPKRCGHMDGKLLLDRDEYLKKLNRVLDTRNHMMVVARTDAGDPDDIIRRITSYADAGADILLVDGMDDMHLLNEIKKRTGKPLAFNILAGGKATPRPLEELQDAGVSVVLYSTPCLFAAQEAVQESMRCLKQSGGILHHTGEHAVELPDCQNILEKNLRNRDR